MKAFVIYRALEAEGGMYGICDDIHAADFKCEVKAVFERLSVLIPAPVAIRAPDAETAAAVYTALTAAATSTAATAATGAVLDLNDKR